MSESEAASEAAFFRALAQSRLPDDSALRARLAHEWLTSAQAEHASIASFSRFSLELLAVGAPPELLAGAHQAALDEIRHARLSFALASHYAGVKLGPGALQLPSELPPVTLLSAATAAAHEGCVSETLAAIEVAEAAELASEPAVRMALAIIAPDEMRHAQLAWTFVRWAIGAGDETMAQAVRVRFELSIAQVAALDPRVSTADAALLAYGRLCGARRNAARRSALREVIEPAVTSLFAEIAVARPAGRSR